MDWVSLFLGIPKNSSIPHGMKELNIWEICTSSNLRAKLLCDILRVKKLYICHISKNGCGEMKRVRHAMKEANETTLYIAKKLSHRIAYACYIL